MDVYVARQAILNSNREVIAYELLYRNNNVNKFSCNETLNLTLDVLKNSLLVIGLDKITDGKMAFINFDQNLIESDIIESLSKRRFAVEVLETVIPNKRIVERCKVLKQKGYTIALDDFEYSGEFDELIEYVDIIKVDFLLTKGKERKEIIKKVKNKKVKFLAEKVETQADYKEALEYGYSYFQGYFLCKPVILTGKDIPKYKLNYIKLIKELNKENIDLCVIEEMVKSDVSLTYKLLKSVNSAFYNFKRKITSIRDAVITIGLNELKRWTFIIALNEIVENNTEELVRISLIRAFFAEALSKNLSYNIEAFDAFLMGMFSLGDVLMNAPMKEVLRDLPVAIEVKEALVKKKNEFYDLLQLIISYENGEWEEVNDKARKLKLDKSFVSDCYFKAIDSVTSLENVF